MTQMCWLGSTVKTNPFEIKSLECHEFMQPFIVWGHHVPAISYGTRGAPSDTALTGWHVSAPASGWANKASSLRSLTLPRLTLFI